MRAFFHGQGEESSFFTQEYCCIWLPDAKVVLLVMLGHWVLGVSSPVSITVALVPVVEGSGGHPYVVGRFGASWILVILPYFRIHFLLACVTDDVVDT